MCKDTFPCGSKKVLLNSTTEIVAKAFSRYSRCRKMISSSLTCTRFRGWRTNHICSEYIGKCHYTGFQFLLRAPIQYNPLQIKIYHYLNDFRNSKDLWEHQHLKLRWWSSILLLDKYPCHRFKSNTSIFKMISTSCCGHFQIMLLPQN